MINKFIFNFDTRFLNTKNHISILKFLNISSIGLEIPRSQLSEITKNSDSNIHFFSKLLLREKDGINSNSIKKELNTNRFKYDLIIVEPINANLASIAARDRRIDGIRITSDSRLKIFNKRYGRRLKENNKFIEIDLSSFRLKRGSVELRPIIRIITAMKNCGISYILSINAESEYQLRSYRGLQAIGLLLGLSQKETSVKFLIDRLELNNGKITHKIPFDGVEIE